MSLKYVKDGEIYNTDPYIGVPFSSSDFRDDEVREAVKAEGGYRTLMRPVISTHYFDGEKWRLVQGSHSVGLYNVDTMNEANGAQQNIDFASAGGNWGKPPDQLITFFGVMDNYYVIKLSYSPIEEGEGLEDSAFFKIDKNTGVVTKFCSNEYATSASSKMTSKRSNLYYPYQIYFGLSHGSYFYAFTSGYVLVFNKSTGSCVTLISHLSKYTPITMPVHYSGNLFYALSESGIVKFTLNGTSVSVSSINSISKPGTKYANMVYANSYFYVIDNYSSQGAQTIRKFSINGSLSASVAINSRNSEGTYNGVTVGSVAASGEYVYIYLPDEGPIISATMSNSQHTGQIWKFDKNLNLISKLDLQHQLSSYHRGYSVLRYGVPSNFIVIGSSWAFLGTAYIDLTTGKVSKHQSSGKLKNRYSDYWGNVTNSWDLTPHTEFVVANSYGTAQSGDVRKWDFTFVTAGDSYTVGESQYNISSPGILRLKSWEVLE